MSPEALQKVANYTVSREYTGVAEFFERAHILGHLEEIAADELPVDDKSYTAPNPRRWRYAIGFEPCQLSVDLRELLIAFEKGLIERALEQANGVQAEAARLLGVSRSDIGYKVAKFALARPADTT